MANKLNELKDLEADFSLGAMEVFIKLIDDYAEIGVMDASRLICVLFYKLRR